MTLLLICGSAFGATIGTTAQVVLVPAPPSVEDGVLESDTQAIVFDEAQAVSLDSDLVLNATATGEISDPAQLTPGIVPAGTWVHSHMIHADAVGNGPANLVGTATFDEDILGLIVLTAELDSSDAVLGADGTAYPMGQARGLGLAPDNDIVSIEPDRRTVRIDLTSLQNTDQLRIVTVAPVGDTDGDGFNDDVDNCPLDPNPLQLDTDNDGVGEVCEACHGGDDNLDRDDDGIPDACDRLRFGGIDPGVAGQPNTWTATDAAPGARVLLTASKKEGRTPIPGCDGETIPLENPFFLDEVNADGGGIATGTIDIPQSLQGQSVFFVAVAPDTCEVTKRNLYILQ